MRHLTLVTQARIEWCVRCGNTSEHCLIDAETGLCVECQRPPEPLAPTVWMPLGRALVPRSGYRCPVPERLAA